MEERSTHVDVGLLTTHKQQRRKSVYHYSHGCCPRHCLAVNGGRGVKLVNALYHYGTYGNEQHYGVEKRDEHRALPVAVGETVVGMDCRQLQGNKHHDEAEHVAEVMTCVGEQ